MCFLIQLIRHNNSNSGLALLSFSFNLLNFITDINSIIEKLSVNDNFNFYFL